MSRAATSTPLTNVILVTADGVRWQEVFHGVDRKLAQRSGLPSERVVSARQLLPRIYRHLLDRGIGLGHTRSPMVASGPNYVSLPGYREIFSGRTATGCTRNDCPPIRLPTVLDQLQQRAGSAPTDIAVISSWEMMAHAVSRAPCKMVLSSGRSFGTNLDLLDRAPTTRTPLRRGKHALPAPGHADYRPDRFTIALALSYLRRHRPRFLAIGLGDTDEHAHADDYGAYLAALRTLDRFVGALVATLRSMGAYGARTAILLTTDHGRAARFDGHGAWAPESGRVWLVAAGHNIATRGRSPAGRLLRLADIAPSLRILLGLAADHHPLAGSPIEELLLAQSSAVVHSGQEGTNRLSTAP